MKLMTNVGKAIVVLVCIVAIATSLKIINDKLSVPPQLEFSSEFLAAPMKPYEIYSNPEWTDVHVYLTVSITPNTRDYFDLIEFFNGARQDATITLHINNFGGSVVSGTQLYYAIKNSPAHVHIKVDTMAMSMGAILALSGDSLEIPPYGVLMFHTYSTSMGEQKISEIKSATIALEKQQQAVLSDCCSKLLTADEFDRIVRGEDVYLTGLEVNSRLNGNNK